MGFLLVQRTRLRSTIENPVPVPVPVLVPGSHSGQQLLYPMRRACDGFSRFKGRGPGPGECGKPGGEIDLSTKDISAAMHNVATFHADTQPDLALCRREKTSAPAESMDGEGRGDGALR